MKRNRVIGPTRQRFSTEEFDDSVRVPQEQFSFARAQAVPSTTMDSLKSQGELVRVLNSAGQYEWIVVYKN